MIKLLDRNIIKRLLLSFFFIVFGTVTVILVIHFVTRSDTYIGFDFTFREVGYYYLTLTPFMVNFITPIASFLATVSVTLRMAKNSEIIAMLSSGITYRRFLVPFFLFGFIISLFSYGLGSWLIPIANRDRIMFEINYLGRVKYSSFKNIHMKISDNQYIYIKSYDPYKIEGSDFTLETIDSKMSKKLYAKKIVWDDYTWKVLDWHSRKINGMTEELTNGFIKTLSIELLPSDLGDDFTIRNMLNDIQLNNYINKLKNKNSDTLYLFYIEKYIRFMYPMSIFLLIFVGILFSTRRMRSGIGSQIAISFVLGLGYVAFFMVSKGRAEIHKENLLLTIWMPNIIFSIVVSIIYKFMPK